MVKRSSDPPGSPPRSQSSGMGPSASCRYCCPLCPAGVQYSGKIRFIEPQKVDGHKRPFRVPPAAVHHGRARQISGTGPRGYCRRVLWVPGPAGQYSGKVRFIWVYT